MSRIEAEDMTLSKYFVGSGDTFISTFSTGTATSIFEDSTGTYDISLGYFDEKDGISEIEVFVDNQLLKTLTLDNTSGSGGPDAQSFVNEVISSGFFINNGAKIEIRGTKNNGERARVDYIDFTPVSLSSTNTDPDDSTNTDPDDNSTVDESPTSQLRIEAEDMTLSKYFVESGNTFISTFSTGTATSTFAGVTGSYTVSLGYFDEKDGISEIEVFIDNQLLKTLTLDNTSGSGGPDAQSFVNEVISSGFLIENGAEIEIRGTRNNGERARIDYIDFTPISSDLIITDPVDIPNVDEFPSQFRIEAEEMTLSKYYVDSGKQFIGTFSTGTATSTFAGATDSYTVSLGYFDEKDGISEIEVFIDDQLLKSVILDDTSGSAGPDAQSFVSEVIGSEFLINNGAKIEIRGTKNNGEQARVDYIEFTTTSSTPDNIRPTVFNDSFRTNERFSVTGNVFEDNGRGSDSDPDGDQLSIVEVNGSAANVGTRFTLDSGAVVTLDEDGTLLYDPNNQLTALNQGESLTERFTYTVSDGNGETATATVFVKVNGLDESPTSNLIAVKDFETKDFSGWRSQFSTEASGSITSDITRDGQYSALLQFKADDPLYNGKRRTEIFESGVESGSEYWYGFSHYLPEDWVIHDSWTVLAQWHGQPDPGSGEPHRVPPLDLLIVGDEWKIKHRADADAVSLSKSPPTQVAWTGEIQEDLGTWTDWVFHTKWSHEDDGLLEVWKNGAQIVDYSGPLGFNDEFGPYFKAGVYSNKGDIPFDRQVYFDEYRLGDANSSYLEVAPGLS